MLSPVRTALMALLESDRRGMPSSIDVVIAYDSLLRDLNQRFRAIDSSTDVLSFPAPSNPIGLLGDVAVSWDFAERQASQRKVRIVEEAAMLAVHGALHLLGMDDSTESGRLAMVQRQNMVMQAVGFPTDQDWCSLPHGGK